MRSESPADDATRSGVFASRWLGVIALAAAAVALMGCQPTVGAHFVNDSRSVVSVTVVTARGASLVLNDSLSPGQKDLYLVGSGGPKHCDADASLLVTAKDGRIAKYGPGLCESDNFHFREEDLHKP